VTFEILHAEAAGILTPTSGFIAQAGFTHSLSPARNCTFACTYCYVPTMGIYGGLKPADWQNWGRFTTFKANARELLRRSLRHDAAFQRGIVAIMKDRAEARGRRFAVGPEAFAWLAKAPAEVDRGDE